MRDARQAGINAAAADAAKTAPTLYNEDREVRRFHPEELRFNIAPAEQRRRYAAYNSKQEARRRVP
jgi:hypothetical protein